jgi:hypothetical protein
VPTCLDCSNTRHDLSRSFDPLTHAVFVRAIQPLFVRFAQIDRTLKLLRPLQVCRVEVRMADHDGFQSAFRVYVVYCVLVDEGDEIPENISCAGLNEDGALTDSKLLPISKPGLGGYVVDVGITFISCAFVVLLVGFMRETCPGLAADGDVLARILGVLLVSDAIEWAGTYIADSAGFWW